MGYYCKTSLDVYINDAKEQLAYAEMVRKEGRVDLLGIHLAEAVSALAEALGALCEHGIPQEP